MATIKEVKEQLAILRDLDDPRWASFEEDSRTGVQAAIRKRRKAILAELAEEERLETLLNYEKSLCARGIELIAGVDEVGRGPLAGPVVAAAVILPKLCKIKGLNDSKKIPKSKHEAIYNQVMKEAVAVGIGIKDNYVNFWFRFVYPHLSELYMMSPEQFYDAYITSGIDDYLERYFKEVCMEYVGLLNLIGKLPMKISKMGTWIGKEGNIDIIAQNSVRENIVGYCNWNQPEFTMEMKEELLKSMKQAKIDAKYFFLFSAKGFSEEIRQLAEEDTRYILVDMNEL